MEMALEKAEGTQFDGDDVNHHIFLFCLALDRLI